MYIKTIIMSGKKFFTSDWHAGEVAAPENHSYCRPRPTSVMIEEWLKECHKRLTPDDELWFVGDLGLRLTDLTVYQRLPVCRKILVLGDKEYNSIHFTMQEFAKKETQLCLFDEVHTRSVYTQIGDTTFFVAHKPEDCMDENKPAICGHVHGIWRTQKMNNGHPIINVGIDAWGQLVSEELIMHQYHAVMKGYYDGNCFINLDLPFFKRG